MTPLHLYKYISEINKRNSSLKILFIFIQALTRYEHCCSTNKSEERRGMHASPETTDDEVMNYCTAIDLKNEEGRRQFATGTSPETSSSPTMMSFFVAMEAMIFIFCLLLFATHVFLSSGEDLHPTSCLPKLMHRESSASHVRGRSKTI